MSCNVHSEVGYELVLGTSWLGYELAWYDLVRVRVDWKPWSWSWSRSNAIEYKYDITYNGTVSTLGRVHTMRDLGVLIDDKLVFFGPRI